nr:endogenous retrovirus group K member 7 Gag polyprotein-like [Marmota flaviventris]
MCLKVVREWNPWFPEEGSMDVDNWKRVRHNVEKAMRQGEKIPIQFWSIWSILYTMFKAMEEERLIGNLQKELAPSILDLPLDISEKEEVVKDTQQLTHNSSQNSADLIGNATEKKTKVKTMIDDRSVPEQFKLVMEEVLGRLNKLEAKMDPKPLSGTRPSAPPATNPFLAASLKAVQEMDSERSDDEDETPFFAFPIIRPDPANGMAQPPRYEGIDIDHISRLKKAVTMYGPQSHYVKALLYAFATHYNNFAPEDWKIVGRALLQEPEYLQWHMWFLEGCATKARENGNSQNHVIRAIGYPMLSGTGMYDDIQHQINIPPEIHEQLKEIALEAWDKIRLTGEHYGSWTKVSQKPNEPYVKFLSRLKLTIERTVVGEAARQQLLRLLAYKNANENCRRAILPIKDTGDIHTYLKVYKDITSESRKMQLFAETMASTWHALQNTNRNLANMKCFGCGQTGHLRKNCKRKNDKETRGPGICPKCKKGKHWARECRTKNAATLAVQGNGPSGRTPGPGQINGGNPQSFPYNLQPNIVPPWTSQP